MENIKKEILKGIANNYKVSETTSFTSKDFETLRNRSIKYVKSKNSTLIGEYSILNEDLTTGVDGSIWWHFIINKEAKSYGIEIVNKCKELSSFQKMAAGIDNIFYEWLFEKVSFIEV